MHIHLGKAELSMADLNLPHLETALARHKATNWALLYCKCIVHLMGWKTFLVYIYRLSSDVPNDILVNALIG